MDLSLVPFDDILKEIEKRKPVYVVAYIEHDAGRKIIKTQWEGQILEVMGVTSILMQDIVNDYYKE